MDLTVVLDAVVVGDPVVSQYGTWDLDLNRRRLPTSRILSAPHVSRDTITSDRSPTTSTLREGSIPMTRLLVVGAVWPEPHSSAAGAHLLQVLRPLLGQGWDISFASTATESEYATDLPALGISIENVKVNDPGFDDLLRSLQPEVVLFDRFFIEEQFGWRVEQQCPNALRILNCEDLHCLREARERSHRRNEALDQSALQNDVARREIAAILRSDLTLVISSYEMELLTGSFEIDPALLHYCPFMIEPPTRLDRNESPTFEERRDFFSIGNFRHAPNWDGVQWLKNEVWPLVRKQLPKACLRIAGSYASREQMAFHQPEQGFLMEGRIEEVDARFLESRVCLAPLRFGAGLKGKLIDAMRNGTPSVTTSIGAEGLTGGLPWAGAIEEDAASLAQAAVRLYEDKPGWECAQTRGFEILEKNFARTRHEARLIEEIALGRQHLNERRGRNFTGAMLRDHHHRSTRYLSLWIEAKNRLAEN
jgi:glycosyltransferase involved in cell wall biosynthesis